MLKTGSSNDADKSKPISAKSIPKVGNDGRLGKPGIGIDKLGISSDRSKPSNSRSTPKLGKVGNTGSPGIGIDRLGRSNPHRLLTQSSRCQ